jgi:hypothetical protein
MKKYSLSLKSEPLVLTKEGVDTAYTITELNGTERDIYQAEVQTRIKVTDAGDVDKNQKIDSSGLSALAISLAIKDTNGERAFTVKEINSWPGSMVQDLSKLVLEWSGLSGKGEPEKAKKD